MNRNYSDGRPITLPEEIESKLHLPKDDSFKQIRDNWVIVAFIVSLIVTWTTFNSRLAKAESDIQDLSQVITQINNIDINIAVIQEKITAIDKRITSINIK